MITEKFVKTFKSKGLSGVLFSTINYFLSRILSVRIIEINSISKNIKARRVFSKCKLQYSHDGYWHLKPMPSIEDLNSYYSSLYWDTRAGKKYGANTRDFLHYLILEKYIPNQLRANKVFLNIGAGHGGISNLCWLKGMKVINVEPSLLPNFYKDRWTTYSSIYEVNDNSIDIIYGSHSLEHVQNIEEFKENVARVLKKGGFLFWEVPNAECPKNGVQKNKIDIPHTYYFETKFFKKWFSKILLCAAYDQSQIFGDIQNWKNYINEKGSVIRALGQLDKIN